MMYKIIQVIKKVVAWTKQEGYQSCAHRLSPQIKPLIWLFKDLEAVPHSDISVL